MSLYVIKYGGHAMDKPELAQVFAQNVKHLSELGHNVVIVHGGGPHINALLNRLEIKSVFEKGLRVTDQDTMEAVEMVLRGTLNSSLVSLFKEVGLDAVGLSGKDNATFIAKQLPDIGLVGEVVEVNTRLVEVLLKEKFLPIIAPIAYGDRGQSLNVNADIAAAAITGALKADAFVLITDVAGVLDNDGNRFDALSFDQIAELKQSNVITGGMIPKVDACIYAINKGCKLSRILDGREALDLEAILCNNEAKGTMIIKD